MLRSFWLGSIRRSLWLEDLISAPTPTTRLQMPSLSLVPLIGSYHIPSFFNYHKTVLKDPQRLIIFESNYISIVKSAQMAFEINIPINLTFQTYLSICECARTFADGYDRKVICLLAIFSHFLHVQLPTRTSAQLTHTG